jgi:hypothetical protein
VDCKFQVSDSEELKMVNQYHYRYIKMALQVEYKVVQVGYKAFLKVSRRLTAHEVQVMDGQLSSGPLSRVVGLQRRSVFTRLRETSAVEVVRSQDKVEILTRWRFRHLPKPVHKYIPTSKCNRLQQTCMRVIGSRCLMLRAECTTNRVAYG